MRNACLAAVASAAIAAHAFAQTAAPPTAEQRTARDIFRELIEINTSYKGGSTTPAARAVAARFFAAGFAKEDVAVIGPDGDKDANVIVRFRAASAARPILLLAHLDVVEALRSDWSMDPYVFTERDGFFYGRGTSDIKDGAATLTAALLRLKAEGVAPSRPIVLALTAGEEGGGGYNGVQWLLDRHRDLVDAEFCLNVDGGDPLMKNGRLVLRGLQSSEKLFQSFGLEVTNPGGHSSMPTRENAIYRLAAALQRIAGFEFPVHLNETTRAYFARYADLESGRTAADMRAIAINERDDAVAGRLSASPFYNAQLRTTCVATMLEGGHAQNALPQTARAVVNCRILPEETPEQTQAALARVVADPQVRIAPLQAAPKVAATPSRLSRDVLGPIERVTAKLMPGVPVIPQMETGATDGAALRAAGIPTYGVSGVALDMDDIRAHGRDERIMVKSFYDGVEYIYQLVREFVK